MSCNKLPAKYISVVRKKHMHGQFLAALATDYVDIS